METGSDSAFGLNKADARNLKSELEKRFDSTEGLVDAIITSPPYADVQNYGDHDDQVGEQPYEDFLSDLRMIFKQCYEVATGKCTLWVVTDTFRRNNRLVRPPFDIAEVLENLKNREHCTTNDCDGWLKRDRGNGHLICQTCGEDIDPLTESWRLNDHLIWNKQRTRPWRQKGQLRNVYEHISMFSKSDEYKYNSDDIRVSDTDSFAKWWVNYPERYHPCGKLPDNIWEFPIPNQGQWGPKLNYHPSPFPEGLVERMIRLSTDPGDVILDPFAGVGSTLAIAERLHRKPIGFELNEDYIDYYYEHVRPRLAVQPPEQQTLSEEGNRGSLPYKIWTLRIHKYAIRLQRELVSNEDINIVRADLSSIFAVTDPSALSSGSPPTSELYFVGDSRLDDASRALDEASSGLLSENRGSGDYYEVDFELSLVSNTKFIERFKLGEVDIDPDSELYVYPDGVHHWYQKEIDLAKWQVMINSSEWRDLQTANWAPLVSSLPIRIENPEENVDFHVEKDQSSLKDF